MKISDSGDFYMLYIEGDEDRASIVQAISGQKKPVVILLADQVRLLPEDFNSLKHVKRQLDLPILFVIAGSEHLTQLAARHGFPCYPSMDALSDALLVGSAVRQRHPSAPAQASGPLRKTRPLVSPSSDRHEPIEQTGAAVWGGVDEVARGQERGQISATLQPAPTALPNANLPPSGNPRRDGVVPAAISASDHLTPSTAHLPSPSRRNHPEGGSNPSLVMDKTGEAMRSSPAWSFEEATRPTAPLPEKRAAYVPPPPRPGRRPPRQRSLVALAVLMLIALLVAGLGSFMVFFHGSILQAPATAATVQTVGHVAFLNSQQVSENSSQGIDDKILVDLHGLPAPAAHKRYYAWLLGDHTQSDLMAVALGGLTFAKGHATLLYPGDAAHTNLLLMTSRFLVTEEDAIVVPVAPSPDQSTWRYYGEFSQTPVISAQNIKQYSFLDHLRHLLAADPTLDQMELPGGLNTWLYNNTAKLLEWTTSMREPWEDTKNIDFVRRQTIRTLDYLDGIAFVGQDLPPGTPVLVNGRSGSVGLLQVGGPAQDPPSYLSHIVQHLNGLLAAGKFSPQLRSQAATIVTGLNNIQHWLEQVRSDGRQIMRMSDAQLRQPAALDIINDMISNVSNAFAGQPDPVSGQMNEGVSWIHEHMQELASIDVAPYHASSSSVQMIQDIQHLRASLPAQREVH